jgi:hypothetical protein
LGRELVEHVLVEWNVSCRFAFCLGSRAIYVSRKKCFVRTQSRITHLLTHVNNFGAIFGPLSDLYARTHERNYTNYL